MSLRILVAEDSALFSEILVDLLESEEGIEVVGVVDNGEDAVEWCARLRPDLVVMDIQMPRMDGLAATEAIMATCPTPILVVTADPHRGGVDQSFRALSAGALDLMAKPERLPFSREEHQALVRKVRLLAEIPVVRHVRGRWRGRESKKRGGGEEALGREESLSLVGIVASTGGPRALARICRELPGDFEGALLIVQHITEGFSRHLARWLDQHGQLGVGEARDGELPRRGRGYLAPTGKHLSLGADGKLRVEKGDPVGGHCPSGDLLLRSLARHGGSKAIGVVLSGMGTDGTEGLRELYQARCPTLVQDEETSVIYGMPGSAVEAGVVTEVLSEGDLAERLEYLVRLRRDP